MIIQTKVEFRVEAVLDPISVSATDGEYIISDQANDRRIVLDYKEVDRLMRVLHWLRQQDKAVGLG